MTAVIHLYDNKSKASVNPQGRAVRTHTEKWRIDSPSKLTTFEAGLLLGLNQFQPHPSDSAATLRDVEVDQVIKCRNPWRYLVTVVYSTETAEENQQQSEDPLNDPVEIEWEGIDVAEHVWEDRDGKPILNSAKDYFFDPTIEMLNTHVALIVTRNEPVWSGSRGIQWANKVNSEPWGGAEKYELLCKPPKAKRLHRNRRFYWQVVYRFEYNPRGWMPKVLSQGRRELKTVGSEKLHVDILDAHKKPVTDPVPLDANGVRIKPDDLPANAHFLTFKTYNEFDFRDIGLPI